MDTLVQELLDLERQLFNLSLRPDQNLVRSEAWAQFEVLRSAQLSAWSPALRKSWKQDLLSARAEGHNLIKEKYNYILRQVNPMQYSELKPVFPEPSMEKLWLVDWICLAQMNWQEALLKKYPYLIKKVQEVHERADGQEHSFETFIRSELMAYSVNTLRLYASQIDQVRKDGGNLCEDVLENIFRQLGFESLEIAHKIMASKV